MSVSLWMHIFSCIKVCEVQGDIKGDIAVFCLEANVLV